LRYQDIALRQAALDDRREFNQLNSDYAGARYDKILPRVQELAEHGNLWAQTLLGLMYRKGQGVVHDDDKAEQYYGQAARQGWPNAQFDLGTYYKTQFRFREAETWLLKADKQGMFQADLNLGQLYLAKGPLYSEEKSFTWFLRGAERGDKEAQYQTCFDYADGIGVTRDMVEAYRWCYIAAQNGHAVAARNRDHLGEQMQPAEIVRARAAAERWLAEHRNPR
jgi:TPR repeat protein